MQKERRQNSLNKLPVENVGNEDICLFIEPLGNDYHMRPGDSFTVEADPTTIEVHADEPSLLIRVMPGHVIVYINDADPFTVKVTDNKTGKLLEIGHNRPSGNR
jgi:hypothetical protein